MQADAAIGVRALGAVLQIALHRTTNRCQLTPYLMVSSCLQVNLQKRVVFAAN